MEVLLYSIIILKLNNKPSIESLENFEITKNSPSFRELTKYETTMISLSQEKSEISIKQLHAYLKRYIGAKSFLLDQTVEPNAI